MNFNRSSIYHRYEKNHSDPSLPFPRVIPVVSDSTESDFSALHSLFTGVNDLRLQDIAVKVSSAISPSADSYMSINTITHPYEIMQKKNRPVTAQSVDGQVYPFLNGDAVCMKLIEAFREDPCIWESEKKLWKSGMGRIRNSQPFVAFPKDFPVILHPQSIPDNLRPDYIPITSGPSEYHCENHKRFSRKRAAGDGEVNASNKTQVSEYAYGCLLSSEHGLNANSVWNENSINIDNLSINRRSYIDDYESTVDVNCSSSDDVDCSSSDDDNSSSSDDNSAESDGYASDEDFCSPEPASWLSVVISILLNI